MFYFLHNVCFETSFNSIVAYRVSIEILPKKKTRSFLVICEKRVIHNVDVKDSGLLRCYSVPIRRNARQAGVWGVSVLDVAPRFPFYIPFKRPSWPSLWKYCQQIKRLKGTTTQSVSARTSLSANTGVVCVKKLSSAPYNMWSFPHLFWQKHEPLIHRHLIIHAHFESR